LSQVWLFFIGPFMGAIIAGFLFRRNALSADMESKKAAEDRSPAVVA
jgi:hypothetical protein